jgi:serine/threonine protein kinase
MPSPEKDFIRYGGEDIPFAGMISVGKRKYQILKKISRGDRQRYWVYDAHAGPRGDFRQILVVPEGQTCRQHLAVLQRLSHGNPNLPTILECRRKGSEYFLVTSWVRGENLEEYLRRVKTHPKDWPSPIELMKYFRGLAHGLCQLHKHCRVIHGDIRPSNLIFARMPNRFVMIDFGSAWMMERTVGRSIGDGLSEFYASPEQLQKFDFVDFRSDQFSATAVIYELLTGNRPYEGMGGKAGLPEFRDQYQQLYNPPSTLCPLKEKISHHIWKLIDSLIGRGLALDPSKRFQNRSQWLEAMEDLQCECRRKVHFSLWDKFLIRLLNRFVRTGESKE